MPTAYFLNVNFICNERCVFCAAELADGTPVDQRKQLRLDDIKAWLGDELPAPGDRVLLAGGEPTIHRDLLEIVRYLAQQRPRVVLFTNGLRLAAPDYARACVESGITRFQIALYGASPATHDAITRRAGSFVRTLDALNVLGALRAEFDFALEVRLLVSAQTAAENPGVVRVLHERVQGVDAVSLQRLILSEDAEVSNAEISWAAARSSINDTATLARRYGYELRFNALPLCVYEGNNEDHVRRWVRAGSGVSWAPTVVERFRYIDPVVGAGAPGQSYRAALALPAPCRTCDYRRVCGRVEQWYVDRFGAAGLRTMRLDESAASDKSASVTSDAAIESMVVPQT